MDSVSILLPGINPEPWTAPHITKQGGTASGKLTAYKAALREALEDYDDPPFGGDIRLELYFWRRLDSGNVGTERRVRANRVDATNLQKSTEDALQKILFTNDRNVAQVYSCIMEQGPDVDPRIYIIVAQPVPTPEPQVRPDLWMPPLPNETRAWIPTEDAF